MILNVQNKILLKSEAVLDARTHFNVASNEAQCSERDVRDKRKDVLTDFFQQRAAIKFLAKTNARWMPLIRNDLNAVPSRCKRLRVFERTRG